MKDIYVLHAKDIEKALPIVAGRPSSWLYLGEDIKQKESISHVLGKENRYFIGDSLQQIAYQQKQPYLDFIAELGVYQKNKRCWWASNTAYRNPILQRDLFSLWCYDALFGKICQEEKGDQERPLVVFVEDRWLYRHLWEHHQKNGPGFHFLSRKSLLPETLKSVLRGIAGRVYMLLKATYEMWRSRSIASKNTIPSGEVNRKQVYIYSWIQDRFFGENGNFDDAYFGRLAQILTKNGLNVAYITQPFLPPALRRRCLDCGKYEFTFLDRYISFSHILKCLFTIFPISYGTKQKWLRVLLWRQMLYEISPVAGAQLYYFAFKSWLKKMNKEEITIIYPFENQPWEKMLCMAARDLNKKVKLIGYQHSTVPLLLLNHFLGAGECNDMPLPNLIAANSEYTLDLLNSAGYGETKLVNGGALRYEHLHQMADNLARRKKKLKTVLVAFPYSVSQSQEMLLAVFNAFGSTDKHRFIIKPHPAVTLERLEIQLSSWPTNFEKTDKPIPEILKEADLVIYSSGTIGLESLLAGVPVIRYCPEHTIGYDAMDAVDEQLVRRCSENNLRQVVLSALNQKDNHPAKEAALGARRFFSPVDEEAWKQIVKCGA